jgi:hypothetical protein
MKIVVFNFEGEMIIERSRWFGVIRGMNYESLVLIRQWPLLAMQI